MKDQISRRNFIKSSVTAGAVIGFPTIIPGRALGKSGAVAPSNRVHIGVLACGNRSQAARAYVHNPNSQIVAVCDPFLDRRVQRANEWGVADHYNDFRDVLAREDVDGVHISTGDYWHVPMSLAAARAGKDVYCEKPLGLTIEQDLAARDIVHKYKRVFQYGTQQRSSDACRMGLELVLNGHIGDVKEVFVWAPGGRAGGNPAEQPVPEGFDYDMWLGPAPKKPYAPDRVSNQGTWFIYDYAIGFLGGWGAHPMDQLQWWADEMKLGIPVEYSGTGTIPTHGLFDTVASWDMVCRYPGGMKLNFMDTSTAHGPKSRIPKDVLPGKRQPNGTLFIGTKGWVNVSRGLVQASSDDIRRKAKDPGPLRLTKSQDHFGNFVDSIVSRSQPIATVDSACRSDLICQMSDIAIRTGETVRWDEKKETVVGSEKAVGMMRRPLRAPWSL